ncbi:MAG: hypothetical protein FWH24_03550 [Oscillospiraceae bacterium]|nr:hypothetical protein [Oscillospiraceae bacterium]
MKKIIAIALLLALACLLLACGGDENNDSATDDTEIQNREDSGGSSVESWRQFLENYGKWADDLIALNVKFEDGDISVSEEYLEKLAELPEWIAEWGNLLIELTTAGNPDDLSEFEAEADKIAEKYGYIYDDE